MKNSFRIVALFLLLGLPTLTYGQQPSMGVMGGASYYIGELNPYGHFQERSTHGSGGVLYRYPLSERFLLRGQVSYGKVSGTDANAKTDFRRNRNLHFRSDIVEVAGLVELNFFEHAIGDEDDVQSPYLFAGLAYFRMNPEAQYQGEWHELQPLGTEGQGVRNTGRDPYHLDQISIPFGLGIKVNLGEWVTLGAEWGMRKTYTDYMDDVSRTYIGSDRLRDANGDLAAEMADRRLKQGEGGMLAGKERGDPETDDWYVFSGLTLNVRVSRKKDVCSSFNSGR